MSERALIGGRYRLVRRTGHGPAVPRLRFGVPFADPLTG